MPATDSMDLQIRTPAIAGAAAARCSCLCCCSSLPSRRSVKRKLDLIAAAAASSSPAADVARVEAESEAAALREAIAAQQQSIRDLCTELEEERNASASSANETMSMILRLQREKAEALMEARQFKRFAEEKIAHDQRELADLEDLLFRRDHALQSLSAELQSYRHCLLSYGIDLPPSPSPDPSDDAQFDLPAYDYPPLRCDDNNVPNPDGYYTSDIEKHAFEEIPHHAGEDELQSLEQRISELETVTVEKEVLSGLSPRRMAEEFVEDEFPVTVDRASDEDGEIDDTSDRVYTIDAIHAAAGEDQCRILETNDVAVGGGGEVEEGDIKKLHSRLQALEADRESMRQAIVSMRTEKAQLVLLREIAQQLCKEVKPERRVAVVKKPSLIARISSFLMVKWIGSVIIWRRKASQSKYTFGLSKNNAGLLLLLDKSPCLSQWRRLSRT